MPDQIPVSPVTSPYKFNFHKVFAAVGVILIVSIIILAGIWYYIQSAVHRTKTSENNSTKISTASSKINGSKTYADISFTPNTTWVAKQSTSPETNFYVSHDYTEAQGFGAETGYSVYISKTPANGKSAKCNPTEKEDFTSNVRCITVKGISIKLFNTDYEGHYLVYTFVYKNNLYSVDFSIASREAEQKYLTEFDEFIKTIEFK